MPEDLGDEDQHGQARVRGDGDNRILADAGLLVFTIAELQPVEVVHDLLVAGRRGVQAFEFVMAVIDLDLEARQMFLLEPGHDSPFSWDFHYTPRSSRVLDIPVIESPHIGRDILDVESDSSTRNQLIH